MFPIVDSCSKIVSQTNLTERGYLAHAFGTEFAVQILGFLLFSLVIQRSRGVATISEPCWNPYKNREHREPMTLNAGGGFGQLFGVGKSCEWFLSIAMFDYQRGIAVMNKIWLCLHIWSWRSGATKQLALSFGKMEIALHSSLVHTLCINVPVTSDNEQKPKRDIWGSDSAKIESVTSHWWFVIFHSLWSVSNHPEKKYVSGKWIVDDL